MSLTSWLCALGTGLALAHAVDQARRLRRRRDFPLVSRGQALRRLVSSLLLALLLVLVEAGLVRIPPREAPRAFLAVWGVVSVLVFVVLLLALLDWRELRANREIARAREILSLLGDRGNDRG